MNRCEECNMEFKNLAGLLSHNRIKHAVQPTPITDPAEEPVVDPVDATEAVASSGAPREPLDLGRPSFHKAHSNIRSIKLMVPVCKDDPDTGFQGCQDKPGAETTTWWKGCIARGHDPYYRLVKRTEVRPKRAEVCADCEQVQDGHSGHAFRPSGKFLQLGVEEFAWWEEQPNTEQVQVSPRVSGTLYGIDPITWRRGWGRIRPGDHPTKPLKDFCEYHNCWNQNVVIRDKQYGNYCTEVAAKRVVMDTRGKSIEDYNQEKLQEQLDAVRVG